MQQEKPGLQQPFRENSRKIYRLLSCLYYALLGVKIDEYCGTKKFKETVRKNAGC